MFGVVYFVWHEKSWSVIGVASRLKQHMREHKIGDIKFEKIQKRLPGVRTFWNRRKKTRGDWGQWLISKYPKFTSNILELLIIRTFANMVDCKPKGKVWDYAKQNLVSYLAFSSTFCSVGDQMRTIFVKINLSGDFPAILAKALKTTCHWIDSNFTVLAVSYYFISWGLQSSSV